MLVLGSVLDGDVVGLAFDHDQRGFAGGFIFGGSPDRYVGSPQVIGKAEVGPHWDFADGDSTASDDVEIFAALNKPSSLPRDLIAGGLHGVADSPYQGSPELGGLAGFLAECVAGPLGPE
jgi:hypothetical protein